MVKKGIKKFLIFCHIPNWLFFVLVATLLLRIPSFFEPYYYGDEMIYLTLGQGIKSGLTLYKDIHDNKPPLLYYTAAIAGSVFWFRAILTIWMLITTTIFWKLVIKLFPKNTLLQITSAISFAILTTLPLLEGQISNAELFMIGPTIIAFYLLIDKKFTTTKLFLSGVLFSISTLYKVPGAFDLGAIIFFWIFYKKLNLKKSILILLGYLTPILLTIIWFASKNSLNEYIKAAFLQNIGYLSSWRPSDVEKPFLLRNLPLIIRSILLILGICILYIKKTKISKEFVLTALWLLFSLFAVTLSERPYPHYLIQSVAPVSIFIGMLVARKNKEQVLSIIPLTLAIFVPVYYGFWLYPSFPYYQRFIKFATKSITKEEYFNLFGQNTLKNYKIAEYVLTSTNKNDKIFVWGDTSVIYALTKRLPPIKYTTDYHIKDFYSINATIAEIKKTNPKIIIIMTENSEILTSEFKQFLDINYVKVIQIEEAIIYKSLSPIVKKALFY